ncbi:MAG: hypothetical protein JNK48_24690 [Bryobacterales bacterium]|nr:hypothetical protein [Bryobacterales bacterium]
MPGYLEGYGVNDAKRERRIKAFVIAIVTVVVVSGSLYAIFRDYKEESTVKRFLEAIQRQDFATAYTYWGCTKESPCRDYPYNKFLEDWGPKGENQALVPAGIYESERCGTGFLAALHAGNQDVALWVERSTGVLGYAPWINCPEKKLRLMKWLKMKFGKG